MNLLIGMIINLASIVISLVVINKSKANDKIIDQLNMRLDQLIKKNYGTQV
jgi:hypothetical protein